ncbi:MAG: hypothetical protein V9E83_03050 [Baekduia sp.]
MALTGELLAAVASGAEQPLVRVFVPGPTLAFGRLDARADGFAAAEAAARVHGFVPLVRHAGGRAAAYDHGSVVIERIDRAGAVAEGIEERFAAMATVAQRLLADAGVDAQIGELPGEYCPGRFSLHAGGRKLAGVAQRSIVGASLTTLAIAVTGGDRLRAVLTDVQSALAVDWDPATAGSADEFNPGLTASALAGLAGQPARWQ